MSSKWYSIAEVRFSGKHFDEHALDAKALREITNFIDIVANTAKEIWRNEHPDKKQLPPHFKEERVRLSLRRIEPGSAIAPLEILVETAAGTFEFKELEEPVEAQESVDLIYDALVAAERGESLPSRLPKTVIGSICAWGISLSAQEQLQLSTQNRRKRLAVTQEMRERLQTFVDASYEDSVEVIGEILEADVRQHRFQLWRDGQKISVEFKGEQEKTVTSALHEHGLVHLRVRGRGRHSPSGKLDVIHDVEEITAISVGDETYDTSAKPIETVIAETVSEIPADVWNSVPKDGSANVDHYLYGAPKR